MAKMTVYDAIVTAIETNGVPDSWEVLISQVIDLRGKTPDTTVHSSYSQLKRLMLELPENQRVELPNIGPGRGRKGVSVESLAERLKAFAV